MANDQTCKSGTGSCGILNYSAGPPQRHLSTLHRPPLKHLSPFVSTPIPLQTSYSQTDRWARGWSTERRVCGELAGMVASSQMECKFGWIVEQELSIKCEPDALVNIWPTAHWLLCVVVLEDKSLKQQRCLSLTKVLNISKHVEVVFCKLRTPCSLNLSRLLYQIQTKTFLCYCFDWNSVEKNSINAATFVI